MNPKNTANEILAHTIIANMEKRGFEGYYCHTGKEAVEKALSLMNEGSCIGFGGSMTLEDIGMLDAVEASPNHTLIDRRKASTQEEKDACNLKIFASDYFLTGTNAITMDGELVNIDATGNRVCFITFGPKNVIVIAGMNKVVRTVPDGVARVRDFATPPNAIRLSQKTPCAAIGHCQDCLSPDCLCCHIVRTRKSRIPGRIKIILVDEALGY